MVWSKAVVGMILGALALGASVGPARAAEEGSSAAIAAWSGRGWFFEVGENRALFLGALSGTLFIETKQGALEAARIVCPGAIEMDRRDASQIAEGQCTITTRKGDKAYSRFACKGTHLAGCAGRFTLTGGTGALKGISGESDIVIRSAVAELSTKGSDEAVQETAAGLVIWPALRYRIP